MSSTGILIIAIILVAMLVLSRRSAIRIEKPDDSAVVPATTKQAGKGVGERIIRGETVVVKSREKDTITVIETALPEKLKLVQTLAIDMRGDSIDFGRLVTSLRERSQAELNLYKKLLPELQVLIRCGVNYINIGHETRRITVEIPVPPDQISEEMITEIGTNLISIKDTLPGNSH